MFFFGSKVHQSYNMSETKQRPARKLQQAVQEVLQFVNQHETYSTWLLSKLKKVMNKNASKNSMAFE